MMLISNFILLVLILLAIVLLKRKNDHEMDLFQFFYYFFFNYLFIHYNFSWFYIQFQSIFFNIYFICIRIKCCVMLGGCNLVSGDINIHLVGLGVWLKKNYAALFITSQDSLMMYKPHNTLPHLVPPLKTDWNLYKTLYMQYILFQKLLRKLQKCPCYVCYLLN